jgi:hypothetical protein
VGCESDDRFFLARQDDVFVDQVFVEMKPPIAGGGKLVNEECP